jgi:hypothetical protein
MTIRIEKDLEFYAGVHLNTYNINAYNITLSMLIETTDIHEQTVALERIAHFISLIMQNCVFINGEHKNEMKKYKAAGIEICELPAEPHDHLIASLLILKLNAIMEGKIRITDLILDSMLGEGFRYSVVAKVAESQFKGFNWWNKSNLCVTSTYRKSNSTDNVVKLFDDEKEWEKLGLSWQQKIKKK